MIYARRAIGNVWRKMQCLKIVLTYGILLYTIEVEDNNKNSPNIICISESWISLVSSSTQLASISFSNQFFDQK